MAAIDFYINPVTLHKIDADAEDLNLELRTALETLGGVIISAADFECLISYTTKIGTSSNIVLDGSAADIGRLKTFKDKRDERFPMVAFWRATVKFYPFGAGISRNVENKKKEKVPHIILYSSKQTFEHVCTVVSKKCYPTDEVPPKMDIVVGKKGIGHILADETMQDLCSVAEAFYIQRQCSYSNSTYLTLAKFDLPNTVTNPAVAFTQVVQHPDPTFLDQIDGYIESKAADQRWEDCINKGVTDLNDWSEVIQPQHGYNEATRSLIVQAVTRCAALYSKKAMYVQPSQSVGTVPPSHFLGTGPLDVVFGGQTIVSHVRDEQESGDEGGDEEAEEGGESIKVAAGAQYKYQPLDTAGRVVHEVKITSTVGNPAFCQLSRIVHDHAFVSDERQRELVDVSGSALLADPGQEGAMKRKRDEIFEAERMEVKRARTKVTGVISTGNSWDCFLYTAPDDRPDSKFKIKYLGHLDMPVLTYKVVSSDLSVFTTSSSSLGASALRRGSGATAARSVCKRDVERVVAMMIMGADDQFTA